MNIASLVSGGSNTQNSERPSALSQFNAEEFLNIMTAELVNQNPLEPLDSAEFVNQLSGMGNLEMVNQLTETISTMLMRESVFQAGSLLDRMVEFQTETGALEMGLVQDVRIDGQGKVELGLVGGQTIQLQDIRRVLTPPAQTGQTTQPANPAA